MTTTHFRLGCLAIALMMSSACGPIQIRSADTSPEAAIIENIDANSAEIQPIPAELPDLPSLRRTSRPANAAWLLDPVHVAFRDLEAPEAFDLVTGGRALHFDLRLPELPNISYASATDHTKQDALNAIATRADWAYQIRDDAIHVQDLETRTLLVLAQPGVVESTMSVNALGSGGGSGETDGANVQHSSDPYSLELEPLVTELIAADTALGIPAAATLLPDANALLVTARPSTVGRVAAIVDVYNSRVARSVRIHITVYEVRSSAEQSIGTRLQAVVQGSTGAFVGGWEVRSVETDAQFALEALNPALRYAGTDILLDWLNREGDATINFNDSIEVRNNQIAASSSTRTFQYISSITRQQDALGRERTEVQREQLRTGWAISVHPTIGHDEVTVRLSLARRSLVEERPFQFGESVGTNFVTDDQVRAMTVSLADGESRIITALRSSDERTNRSKFVGLTTRRGGTTANTESVLLMRVELI